MKKRLRKKLRKGEFREYGFEFVLHWDPEVTNWEEAVDAIILLFWPQKCYYLSRDQGAGLTTTGNPREKHYLYRRKHPF